MSNDASDIRSPQKMSPAERQATLSQLVEELSKEGTHLWDVFKTPDGRSGAYVLEDEDEEGGEGENEESFMSTTEEGEESEGAKSFSFHDIVKSSYKKEIGGGMSPRIAGMLKKWKTRSTERLSMAGIYRSLQERFLGQVETGKVIVEASSDEELQHIPVQVQGNLEFYSEDMIRKRTELRLDPVTVAMFAKYWEMLPRKVHVLVPKKDGDPGEEEEIVKDPNEYPPKLSYEEAEAKGDVKLHWNQFCITKNTYAALATYLFRRLLPQGSLDELLVVLEEDWDKEAGEGKTIMDFPHFCEAIFDTIDVWCPTMSLSDYSLFGDEVIAPAVKRAAKADPDTPYNPRDAWIKKKKKRFKQVALASPMGAALSQAVKNKEKEKKEAPKGPVSSSTTPKASHGLISPRLEELAKPKQPAVLSPPRSRGIVAGGQHPALVTDMFSTVLTTVFITSAPVDVEHLRQQHRHLVLHSLSNASTPTNAASSSHLKSSAKGTDWNTAYYQRYQFSKDAEEWTEAIFMMCDSLQGTGIPLILTLTPSAGVEKYTAESVMDFHRQKILQLSPIEVESRGIDYSVAVELLVVDGSTGTESSPPTTRGDSVEYYSQVCEKAARFFDGHPVATRRQSVSDPTRIASIKELILEGRPVRGEVTPPSKKTRTTEASAPFVRGDFLEGEGSNCMYLAVIGNHLVAPEDQKQKQPPPSESPAGGISPLELVLQRRGSQQKNMEEGPSAMGNIPVMSLSAFQLQKKDVVTGPTVSVAKAVPSQKDRPLVAAEEALPFALEGKALIPTPPNSSLELPKRRESDSKPKPEKIENEDEAPPHEGRRETLAPVKALPATNQKAEEETEHRARSEAAQPQQKQAAEPPGPLAEPPSRKEEEQGEQPPTVAPKEGEEQKPAAPSAEPVPDPSLESELVQRAPRDEVKPTEPIVEEEAMAEEAPPPVPELRPVPPQSGGVSSHAIGGEEGVFVVLPEPSLLVGHKAAIGRKLTTNRVQRRQIEEDGASSARNALPKPPYSQVKFPSTARPSAMIAAQNEQRRRGREYTEVVHAGAVVDEQVAHYIDRIAPRAVHGQDKMRIVTVADGGQAMQEALQQQLKDEIPPATRARQQEQAGGALTEVTPQQHQPTHRPLMPPTQLAQLSIQVFEAYDRPILQRRQQFQSVPRVRKYEEKGQADYRAAQRKKHLSSVEGVIRSGTHPQSQRSLVQAVVHQEQEAQAQVQAEQQQRRVGPPTGHSKEKYGLHAQPHPQPPSKPRTQTDEDLQQWATHQLSKYQKRSYLPPPKKTVEEAIDNPTAVVVAQPSERLGGASIGGKCPTKEFTGDLLPPFDTTSVSRSTAGGVLASHKPKTNFATRVKSGPFQNLARVEETSMYGTSLGVSGSASVWVLAKEQHPRHGSNAGPSTCLRSGCPDTKQSGVVEGETGSLSNTTASVGVPGLSSSSSSSAPALKSYAEHQRELLKASIQISPKRTGRIPSYEPTPEQARGFDVPFSSMPKKAPN